MNKDKILLNNKKNISNIKSNTNIKINNRSMPTAVKIPI